MSSLESQYNEWLNQNKQSDFTFEDWERWVFTPKLKKAVKQIKKLKLKEEEE